jgi:hypothetical protein
VGLARSKFKPKFDLELSSRYKDQVEGDDSWENTNTALLVMRWNLFKGGRDRAGMNAALSRKQQVGSQLAAKQNQLRESTLSVWANYLALQRRKVAFRNEVDYSRKTFDAYLNQFSVSKRSMLDVLIVENEYFRSAVQLVTADTDETIAAYRILSLSGDLQVPRYSGASAYSKDYRDLAQALAFPSATHLLRPHTHSGSSVQEPSRVQEAIPVRSPNISGNSSESKKKSASNYVIESTQLYGIEIGPFINRHKLNQATETLSNYGFDIQQISGSGAVRVTRLLEGVYPPDEARRRLAVLKKTVDSAFLLPESGQVGLFAGSFHEPERAARFAKLLKQKQINVTLVEGEIEMYGTVLVVQQVDRKTADTIVEQMSGLGLTAKIIASVPN